MDLDDFKIIPRLLQFKKPAGTSRTILHERQVYFLIGKKNASENTTGWGEIAPLDGLSPEGESFHRQMKLLAHRPLRSRDIEAFRETSPAFRFAWEAVRADLKNGGRRIWFASEKEQSRDKIEINGLIWMGSKDEMFQRIKEKLEQGYACLKLKIGGIHFEEEIGLLRFIREEFGPGELELRLDANGSFPPESAAENLKRLSKFHIHSIEQPVAAGQPEAMAALCEAGIIPIALDEELIGLKTREEKKKLLNTIRPQYLIFKPSLIGGIGETEEYIGLCKETATEWWITSALESNVGLNILAQFCGHLKVNRPQGLGTGKLFTNNILSPLRESGGFVFFDSQGSWGSINEA